MKTVLFVTPDFNENSLGRTYCLWLLARRLGWNCQIHSVVGDRVWQPLASDEFAQDCVLPSPRARRSERIDSLREAIKTADVVIAVKAMPESFGLAQKMALALGRTFVLDYDDPDLEVWQPSLIGVPRAMLRLARHPLVMTGMLGLVGSVSRQERIIVSNPVLQERHGGVVIPHVRLPGGSGAPHASSNPRVAFVGTARKHKGIDVLRRAVAASSDTGITLTITDDAPADPLETESWIGRVPFEEGMRIVRDSDIVVIPSFESVFSRGQLPAKLIDAMFAGRAIIASDLPPIAWALGDAGILVAPNDVDQLEAALRRLVSPDLRGRFGTAARERAIAEFSIDANTEQFEAICRN